MQMQKNIKKKDKVLLEKVLKTYVDQNSMLVPKIKLSIKEKNDFILLQILISTYVFINTAVQFIY